MPELTVKLDATEALNALRTVTSAAAVDVLSERLRQINEEGWTAEHDDSHTFGDMAQAGAAYAAHAAVDLYPFGHDDSTCMAYEAAREMWPWNEVWFKPTYPRRDLVKAAALIIAEIERIDRMQAEDA